MIPSDCLNSTWRLAKENLVLVFQQSWQFIFLPYRAEIYANLKPLFYERGWISPVTIYQGTRQCRQYPNSDNELSEVELGARLVTYGTAVARGAQGRGRREHECDGSFQNMLGKMLFWSNLLIFQVKKMEPRKTITCPGSQALFTLS